MLFKILIRFRKHKKNWHLTKWGKISKIKYIVTNFLNDKDYVLVAYIMGKRLLPPP